MGYFANGTEADVYQELYCQKCVHMHKDYGCPCMQAHWRWGYEYCNNAGHFLHKLIPRGEGGHNERCVFFNEKGEDREVTIDRKNDLLKEALTWLIACEWEIPLDVIVRIEKELGIVEDLDKREVVCDGGLVVR